MNLKNITQSERSQMKKAIYFMSIYLKWLGKANLWRLKGDHWLPGPGVGMGVGGRWAFISGGETHVLKLD